MPFRKSTDLMPNCGWPTPACMAFFDASMLCYFKTKILKFLSTLYGACWLKHQWVSESINRQIWDLGSIRSHIGPQDSTAENNQAFWSMNRNDLGLDSLWTINGGCIDRIMVSFKNNRFYVNIIYSIVYILLLFRYFNCTMFRVLYFLCW